MGELKGAHFHGLKLKTSSNLTFKISPQKERKKIGLGSSAAATVAIIAAILSLHGFSLSHPETKFLLYKLATIAHFKASGLSGSCGDIAASIYGGLILYSRFDPDWLTRELSKNQPIATIIHKNWFSKGLKIKQLDYSNQLYFLVGWTKKSCSTRQMIKKFREWFQHDEGSDLLCKEIASATKTFGAGLETLDWAKIQDSLATNLEKIRLLEERAGFTIETPLLKKLTAIAMKNNGT